MWNCFNVQCPEAQTCGSVSLSSIRRLRRVELFHCPASGGSDVWNCFIFQPPEAQKCRTVSLSSLRRLRSVELSDLSSLRRLSSLGPLHFPDAGGSDVWNCFTVQLPEPQKCGTVTFSSVRRLRSVELLHFPASGSWERGRHLRQRAGSGSAALRTRAGRPLTNPPAVT